MSLAMPVAVLHIGMQTALAVFWLLVVTPKVATNRRRSVFAGLIGAALSLMAARRIAGALGAARHADLSQLQAIDAVWLPLGITLALAIGVPGLWHELRYRP